MRFKHLKSENSKAISKHYRLSFDKHYDISNSSFSNEAKVATVRPIYKNKSRDKIQNYRPVSILSCFSKVYEKFFLEKFKLIGNWKQALNEKFIIGTVLMDLPKAADSIPHDLLITKLYAHGFSENIAVFLDSY